MSEKLFVALKVFTAICGKKWIAGSVNNGTVTGGRVCGFFEGWYSIFVNGIILILKTRPCIKRNIRFLEMSVFAKCITGKKFLVEFNRIKRSIPFQKGKYRTHDTVLRTA